MSIHLIKPWDNPGHGLIIDATSRNKGKGGLLSPFRLGPVRLYDGAVSMNMENAWQFSKVYTYHVGPDGLPTTEWYEWAQRGWADTWAHRYPMGKGAVPQYSWWDGRKLDYVTARKVIYGPLYTRAVEETEVYKELKELILLHDIVYIKDYDVYDAEFTVALNNPDRPCGHGFFLKAMLEDDEGLKELE